MATITVLGHMQRALDFFDKDSIYFCIGRSSPWEDESTPPAEDNIAQTIDEIIGFKKVESKHLVIPDEVNGTIIYRNLKWKIITREEAIANKCRWVFLSSTIYDYELPLVEYRQIGIFVGLETSETKYHLLPEEVTSNGILEIIGNRRKTIRQLDQKETLNIIIEF